MGASRNADVNLIVRAKTEGDKAIAGLGDILEALFDEARSGSGDIAELGKNLGALDKAASSIVGSMDKASSAVERQRASIAESNAEYQALVAQQSAALSALAKQDSFVGPRSQDGLKQYQAIRSEVDRLDGAIGKLFTKIGQQNAQLEGSQSALLKLSATSTAVAAGQSQAEAQIALTTRALAEQATEAQRVSDIQRRINEVTGVDRPDASGSAARAADVLLAADAEYRRLEAMRAQAAAQQELNNQLGERASLEAAIERNTGVGRGRAIDNGATFSALTAMVNEEAAAADASERMDREAQQLRNTLDPLAAVQERFNAALERYKTLAQAGKISAAELAVAEAHLAAEAEAARNALSGVGTGSQKIGLFGLKPYELQNLSYQVNDVVTGLASGQRATQVIAQQGGQILQLFPKVAGNIIGALKNPYIAAAVVTVGAIFVGLKKAADEAERLREFSSQVTFRADGDVYDAKALSASEEGLQRLGAKATEARDAIKALLDDSVAPERLNQFAHAAEETSRVLGIKLADAAKQVADAFTGGYKAVADLDNKLNFLSASEREHIRQLFDEGNAQAARSEALDAYSRKAEAAAVKQRGPWGEAAHALGGAWDAMVKYIANSAPIQIATALMDKLAGAVRKLGGTIADVFNVLDAVQNGSGGADAGAQSAEAKVQRLAEVQSKIRELEKSIADYEKAIANKSPIAGTLQHLVDGSKAQLAQARAELAKLEKNAPDTVNSDPNSVVAKQRSDDLARISREDELQRLRDAGQVRLLTATEKARREELAGQEAARSASDVVVAAAERRRAVAHETAQIEKETDARAKAAAADREREIKQFETRVVGAEGGAGKNPNSTAKGYGQFTERTFLDQFAKVFPEQVRNLSNAQILALRNNEQVAKAIIDNYARENAKFLESFGAKVTAGNLYLAHFLGAGGAKAVLTAPDGKPVDQILRRLPNAAAVLGGNQGYLRTDGGTGRYRTAGELKSFIANRVGDTGTAQTEGQVAINKLLDDAKTKQEDFDLAVRHGNEERERGIAVLQAEAGLHDAGLIAEQRRQAVIKAEQDLRQKVEDANKNLKDGEPPVVVSQADIDKAKELASALFDVQHAKDLLDARLGVAQRSLDTLTQQRDILTQQRDILLSMGEFKQADQIQAQITAIGGSIQDAYDKLIEFYRALSPDDRVRLGIIDDQQLDNLIHKLELAKDTAQEWGRVGPLAAKDVAQSFSGAAANAFNGFLQKVLSGRNVFASLGDSVREFAADFLSSIAQMIAQLLAFGAVVEVLRALGVPVPTSSPISAGVHHTGGVAGSAGGVQRPVNNVIFASALRFHKGGIAGLMPDEVPAILQRGEEILTQSDPRHRANGGLAMGAENPTVQVKSVNVIDPNAMMSASLSTREGEKVFLNFVSKNPRAFRAAMGA